MENISLTRIVNNLIVNASFPHNLGIYQGKIGCVLFFVYYSRYTNQLRYVECTSQLLDEIYEDLKGCQQEEINSSGIHIQAGRGSFNRKDELNVFNQHIKDFYSRIINS